MLQIYFERMKR